MIKNAVMTIMLYAALNTANSDVVKIVTNKEDKQNVAMDENSYPKKMMDQLIERSNIDEITRQFMDRPYSKNILSKCCEETLTVRLDSLDCMTYIDYVVALKTAESRGEFLEKVKQVRYIGDTVSYKTRNHFFIQWAKDNSAIYENVTAQYKTTVKVTRKLKNEIIDIKDTIRYIPKKEAKKLEKELQNGDIIGFYTNKKNLDVMHAGFIIKKDKTYLRHASLLDKKVTEQPFLDYIKLLDKKKKSFKGFIILRYKT